MTYDLNFWLYLTTFVLWFFLATLWVVRIRIYIVLWNKPVPRWATVVTVMSCIATTMTGFRLFFGQAAWTTTTVAVLWLLIGVVVAIATFFYGNREEAVDG